MDFQDSALSKRSFNLYHTFLCKQYPEALPGHREVTADIFLKTTHDIYLEQLKEAAPLLRLGLEVAVGLQGPSASLFPEGGHTRLGSLRGRSLRRQLSAWAPSVFPGGL